MGMIRIVFFLFLFPFFLLGQHPFLEINNKCIIPNLTVLDSINHVSCAGGIDGSVSLTVSGNIGPYYVIWDNNINPSMLTAGVYTCQIIDSIGCVYNHSVVINEPPPFSVAPQITDVSCFGDSDGAVSLNIFGGAPPYSIDWFGANTFGMQAGTYNFTIVDTNNCQYSEIVVVNEPNPIDVAFTITSPSCVYLADGLVALSIAGGVSPYIENWNGYSPSALGIGTYELIVSDVNGCTDTNSITLIAESDMLVIEQSYNVSCVGFCDGATDLFINNGVPPYQSDWFGYDADSLCEGVFFYEITDGSGCIYSDSVSIVAPDFLDLNVTEDNGILSASSIGGTPPISYIWFNSFSQLGTGTSFNIPSAGDYYCIAYDSQYCNSDTVVYIYTFNALAFSDLSLYGFSVYPNPADEILNIEFSTYSNINFEVILTDILGQNISIDSKRSFSGIYNKKFNLSNLEKGVYFLGIKIDSKFLNKAIVIK